MKMIRASLLNGKNIDTDADYTQYISSVATDGIIEGFEVETGKVKPGKARIEVERNNGEKIYILVHNTEDFIINTSGNKKIYIEVKQSCIDNGQFNNENGENIAEIKSGSLYPTKNFLKLANISGGNITNEAKKSKIQAKSLGSGQGYKLFYSDGNEIKEIEFGSASQVFTSNGPNNAPGWSSPGIDIHSQEKKTNPKANDEVLVYSQEDSENKKIELGTLFGYKKRPIQGNISVGQGYYLSGNKKVKANANSQFVGVELQGGNNHNRTYSQESGFYDSGNNLLNGKIYVQNNGNLGKNKTNNYVGYATDGIIELHKSMTDIVFGRVQFPHTSGSSTQNTTISHKF